MVRYLVRSLLAAALVGWIAAPPAQAQDYPNKPITVVSSFAAGGVTDVVARLYFDLVSANLGQRIVLEAKPGAAGVVGATIVKDAKPDGYTLLLNVGDMHTLLPALQKLDFDAINDFEPITLVASVSAFVTVPSSLPVNSVAELVTYAKGKPGGLNFGTQVWINTLLGVMLQDAAGAPMTRISYKGGAPMIIDLVAGRIDMVFANFALSKPYIEAGKVKYLAFAAASRFPSVPSVPAMKGLDEIPTLAEVGYPQVALEGWWGLMAPKGTPRAVVDRLAQAFNAASRDPELIRKIKELGLFVRSTTPDEMKALMVADSERLAKIVKAHDLKAE